MLSINGRKIGLEEPPYIVAELSANHNGCVEKALQTIRIAKDCGVDAIKLQTYTADSMTIDCDKEDFSIRSGLWKGYKLYDLYKEASTPYEWHSKLFNYAKKLNITIFSTPFDEEAVDFLEKLNTPAYKIASFELTDIPLIKYIAKKNKPVLISTGMGTELEIKEALEALRSSGCEDILLFHCISSYPTPTSESNIRMVNYLRQKFNVEVGLSDHTLSNTAAISAITLGASAIEKHFIMSRDEKGPDSDFSIEPSELKELVQSSSDCWESLGANDFSRSELENSSKVFRRSLYFVKDLEVGETITSDHIRRIRPGYGLPPKFYDKLINKKVTSRINRGDRVSWDVIEG